MAVWALKAGEAACSTLWWLGHDPASGRPDALRVVLAFFQALPVAALAVLVLPAVALVGGAIIWQLLKRQT